MMCDGFKVYIKVTVVLLLRLVDMYIDHAWTLRCEFRFVGSAVERVDVAPTFNITIRKIC